MSAESDDVVALTSAVAGLASQVEGLRRTVEPMSDLMTRVDEHGRLIEELAEQVNELVVRRSPPPPSWLLLPNDADVGAEQGAGPARQVLDDLIAWLGTVFLRYTDARPHLPTCWMWHADVVEELLWLMYAWSEAYQGKRASVAMVAEWHDRSRPGVVRRIQKAAGTCSPARHRVRRGWATAPSGSPTVPGVADVAAIAAWWGSARGTTAPEPPERAEELQRNHRDHAN